MNIHLIHMISILNGFGLLAEKVNRHDNVVTEAEAYKKIAELFSDKKYANVKEDLIESGLLPVFIESLKSPSNEIQNSAVIILGNIVTNETKAAIVDSGAIQYLIDLLKHCSDVQVKKSLLNIFEHILFDDNKYRDICYEGGLITALTDFIFATGSTIEDSSLEARTAMWYIGRICTDTDNPISTKFISQFFSSLKRLIYFEDMNVSMRAVYAVYKLYGVNRLYELEAIEILIELVNSDPEWFIQLDLADIMVNLCKETKSPIIVELILPAMKKLAECAPRLALTIFDGIVALKSRNFLHSKFILNINSEFIHHFNNSFTHPLPSVQVEALRFLGSMKSSPRKQGHFSLNLKAFHLINFIIPKDNADNEIVKYLMTIINGNEEEYPSLISSSGNIIQDVIDAGLINLIIKSLDSNIPEYQRKSLSIISNVITNGTAKNIQYLIRKNVIFHLLNSLKSDNLEIIKSALKCLKEILSKKNVTITDESIQHFKKSMPFAIISSLPQAFNEEIYELASATSLLLINLLKQDDDEEV